MKKRANIIATFMMIFALIFICKANVAAAESITVTERTKTSISLSWVIDEDLDHYTITKHNVYIRGYNDSDYKLVEPLPVSNSLYGNYTISGLKAGEAYDIKVTYNAISKYGGEYEWTVGYKDECTLPGKVTGLKQERWYYFIESVDVAWNRQTGCTGYEYYFYNNKNKVVKHEKSDNPFSSYFSCSISNSVVYHGKVRAYTVIDGKTYYGAWSDARYFFTQPQVKKAKISKNKLTVTWKKVSGATSYTIYISNKKGKGFKKMATVSSKKTSYTSKKFAGKKYSSKKKYYVYIRTNKKVNGKTSTSGKLYYWDTKNSMYYF